MKNIASKIKEKLFNNLNKNQAGFSMIEVVVTVAIISGLASGGVVAYNGVTDNSKKAVVISTVSDTFNSAAVRTTLPSAGLENANQSFLAADEWLKTASQAEDQGVDLRGFMIDENDQITDNPGSEIVIVGVSKDLGYDRDGYPYIQWQTTKPGGLTKAEVWTLLQAQNELNEN